MVAEDVAGDAHPTVTFAVVPGDTVLGEVRMVACRTARCVVGVRVLRRGGEIVSPIPAPDDQDPWGCSSALLNVAFNS